MKCPQCGYTDETGTKRVTSAMNIYVHADGKVNGVYNDDAKEITVAGVKLTRKDVYEAKQAEAKAKAAAVQTPAKE